MKSKVIISLFETVRLSVSISPRNLYNSLKSIKELSVLHSHHTRLKLNIPVYVGMCVLDLPKHLMYDWYYNTLKRKYGSQCTLLYTDTDSLLVDLKTPDVYADMESMKTHYDFSDYSQGPPALQRAKQKAYRQVQG